MVSGFGFGEVVLIAMLVLIVFGPRRLPEITRTIGKGIREFRKGMNEIQRELEAAGRETQWKSPPAPPKPATTATDATAEATIAGTAVAADAAGASEQEPPVPRETIDEFVDPWATDSSRPTFDSKPRQEPVIAPPTTEPAERPEAEASPPGEAPAAAEEAADEDASKD